MLNTNTSYTSIFTSTASENIKNAMNSKKRPLINPAIISDRTYPYEYLSSALHLATNDAIRPANKAVQSKNIWKESEIKPKLLVHIP